MKETAAVEKALTDLFDQLDQENFDRVAELLHAEAELADELTGEWLRGKNRVAAYLLAQTGVVTDVASRLASVHSQWLSQDVGLATFVAEQRYSLDDVPRREELTGSAMFNFAHGEPLLMLLHLGAPATARGGDEPIRPASAASREALPEALRRRRRERGLSLRALAKQSSLSASFLSQLERGVADPSISSLRRLAHALDVGVPELLGEPAPKGRAQSIVVRSDERPRLRMPHAGAAYELLAPERDRAMDASLVTLEPSEGSMVPARPDTTEEFVLVLDGLLHLNYGDQDLTLHPGDTAYLDNTVAQRLAATGSRPVSFLAVTTGGEGLPATDRDRLSRNAGAVEPTHSGTAADGETVGGEDAPAAGGDRR